MTQLMRLKKLIFVYILSILSINGILTANAAPPQAEVTNQIFEKVKHNNNWKHAFLTANDAQIVFMNISPTTNPKNEIGMETHKFDQIIFVVEGNGKAILDGKQTIVKSGDMIFIPQGVEHNVINLNAKKSLKILSVYTSMDIPANASYPKKSDTSQD